jgi:hypothetical protein
MRTPPLPPLPSSHARSLALTRPPPKHARRSRAGLRNDAEAEKIRDQVDAIIAKNKADQGF